MQVTPMETRSTIELLALGVIALLFVASLVGAALRWRYPGSASVANFNSRTAAWWVMVLVLVAAFLFGMNGVVLLFASLSGIALYEFLRSISRSESRQECNHRRLSRRLAATLLPRLV